MNNPVNNQGSTVRDNRGNPNVTEPEPVYENFKDQKPKQTTENRNEFKYTMVHNDNNSNISNNGNENAYNGLRISDDNNNKSTPLLPPNQSLSVNPSPLVDNAAGPTPTSPPQKKPRVSITNQLLPVNPSPLVVNATSPTPTSSPKPRPRTPTPNQSLPLATQQVDNAMASPPTSQPPQANNAVRPTPRPRVPTPMVPGTYDADGNLIPANLLANPLYKITDNANHIYDTPSNDSLPSKLSMTPDQIKCLRELLEIIQNAKPKEPDTTQIGGNKKKTRKNKKKSSYKLKSRKHRK
jgi:hypothetical protein